MHRIGGDFGGVVIVGRGQHLERKARRDAFHAFVDTGGVLILLQRARLRIDLLQALAVVNAHLRKRVRVLVLLQAREH